METIRSEDIFGEVEASRQSGELSREVSSAPYRYQSSMTHPGLIEQIDPEGQVRIGEFKEGEFIPLVQTLTSAG